MGEKHKLFGAKAFWTDTTEFSGICITSNAFNFLKLQVKNCYENNYRFLNEFREVAKLEKN